MRNLLVTLLAFTALTATAQQVVAPSVVAPPAGSDWQLVQALPRGQSINVKWGKRSANCNLKSVDADTLTCTQQKDLVFQREQILSVKILRRGRSSLIAAGIGAGVGAGVGAATGCSSAQKSQPFGCLVTPSRGQAAAILGVLFGGVGAGIGALTDFAKSTVYKAP